MNPTNRQKKMKELNKIQSFLLLLGGVLMVLGAFFYPIVATFSVLPFTIGAILFVAMQLKQRYDGPNAAILRLRHIMIFSDILLLVSAALMYANFEEVGKLFHMAKLDYYDYFIYIYNKWVLTLLIAAVLQLYTTWRIGRELSKEEKKYLKRMQ